MYIIEDWAGNLMFNGREFPSFDDAESFLSEFLKDGYDEVRGEYEIVELERDIL